MMTDLVNSPEHYKTGDIECIAAIEAAMTPEEFAGYLRGNIIKYIWRYDKKHRDDLALAQRDLCLLYTSPSPRDGLLSRMPSSA